MVVKSDISNPSEISNIYLNYCNIQRKDHIPGKKRIQKFFNIIDNVASKAVKKYLEDENIKL